MSIRVRTLVQERGCDGATKLLGTSRETCLLIGCGALVTRGSYALVVQAVERLDRSPPAAEPTVGAG